MSRFGAKHPPTADTPLTPKLRVFVQEYCEHFDPQRAGRAAGYTGKANHGLSVWTTRLLQQANVKAAIDAELTARQHASQVRIYRLLRETEWLCYADIGDYFDEHGNVRDIKTLPRDLRAAIASVEILKKNVTAGDGQVDTVLKIRLWNKPQALELSAKLLGLIDRDRAPLGEKPAEVPVFALPPETPGVAIH